MTTGQLWWEVLSCEWRWKRGKVRGREDSEKWFPPFLSLSSRVFDIHFPFFGQAKLSQMLPFSLPPPCSSFFLLLSFLFSLLPHSDQSPTMWQALNEALRTQRLESSLPTGSLVGGLGSRATYLIPRS